MDAGSAKLRPATIDDLSAMHELIAVIERADDQPYLTAVEEAREILEDRINPVSDNVRLLEADGQLIGWAHVTHSPSGQKLERAILLGGIHPDFRRQGLGRLVLDWQIQRATERLSATPDHLEAIAITDRYLWQDDKRALFAAAGLSETRWFDELQRPLSDLPPVTLPEGITVRQWRDDDQERTRLVYNSAFLDHWGTTPRSVDAWASDVIENYGNRLDLSFVALDGDTMVAYCLNAHYPDDGELTGRQDGWIASICTLGTHRGRGIASSLLAHSLHAFADAGLNSSMLGVDSDNPTGAFGIYERMGYRSLQKNVASTLTIRSGT